MNKHNLRAKLLKLLYKDFPTFFVWDGQARKWTDRKSKDVIGRIVTANSNQGERYYLRLLLTHVPGPNSFEDLRTVNTFECKSNRQATLALGLLEDDQSNEKSMQEAYAYQMPMSLCQLFRTIHAYYSPTNPLHLFLKFEEEMTENYVNLQNMTKETVAYICSTH